MQRQPNDCGVIALARITGRPYHRIVKGTGAKGHGITWAVFREYLRRAGYFLRDPDSICQGCKYLLLWIRTESPGHVEYSTLGGSELLQRGQGYYPQEIWEVLKAPNVTCKGASHADH